MGNPNLQLVSQNFRPKKFIKEGLFEEKNNILLFLKFLEYYSSNEMYDLVILNEAESF